MWLSGTSSFSRSSRPAIRMSSALRRSNATAAPVTVAIIMVAHSGSATQDPSVSLIAVVVKLTDTTMGQIVPGSGPRIPSFFFTSSLGIGNLAVRREEAEEHADKEDGEKQEPKMDQHYRKGSHRADAHEPPPRRKAWVCGSVCMMRLTHDPHRNKRRLHVGWPTTETLSGKPIVLRDSIESAVLYGAIESRVAPAFPANPSLGRSCFFSGTSIALLLHFGAGRIV